VSAELLPIGHLANARRALARFTESGSQLDAGDVLDELDELRKLLLDTETALVSLAQDARKVGNPATVRAAEALNAAAGKVWGVASQVLQPAVLRLLADSTVPSGVRRGVA
jgi:hypothetical protein